MSSRSLKTFVVVCQTILLLLALAAAVMAQSPQPSLAPVNPAFANYFQRKSMGLVPGTTDSGYPLRYVPPPVDLSQVQAPKTLQYQLLTLPTSFDLRTQGKLTPIRNQGNCGSCWAFASYGSLESNLMPGESLNFSENHLKNTHGFDISCCDGGNSFMTSAYVARWSSPAYETDDPYNVLNCSSPSVTVRKHVQNVDFIPDRTGPTDNDRIKQAVMTYGAMYTSMWWADAYYNSSQYAYYYSGGGYSNHAVGIVGWDDDFDKNKFATTPPANGAFIVRNSWGTGWGQAGYFYVSYYDSNFGKENALFRVTELTDNYDHIYQYDPLGWVNSLGYGSNTAWFANVFTASQNEMLSAVSFYAASVSSSYEIRVYLDPTSGPINPSGPVFSTSGTIAEPGYQTIPISGTPVTGGQDFSVVIMLTTPGFIYPVPLETQWGGYSGGATANAGESYISASGGSWTDLTSTLANANCCIKAFTSDSMGIVVTPPGDLASFGAVGGPFSPSSLAYTVTNTGSLPIDWTAGKTEPWVSLSSTGGSLAAGADATVTVSINSQADSLDNGVYSDVVSFVNATNGQGNTTRGVTLTVRDPCLEVSPAEDMTSYGETQGPFTPASTVYTLTNT
ncbi:MAG TPA: lectin like domain-containing protein, partial [Armatimonadota bacterium]|nr:lectin like domain-containing protein [Armatimonadota bacterium]